MFFFVSKKWWCRQHIAIIYVFDRLMSARTLLGKSRKRRAQPSCLCNRSLGANLLEARDFKIVTCSHNCRRPQFYFHNTCAQLYVESLKHCGFCKSKLVALGDSSNSCLRDAVQLKRSRKRRRLGSTVRL